MKANIPKINTEILVNMTGLNEVNPRSRVLLKKLTVHELVEKFPAFYGTRRFITVFTTARHLPLSRARLLHSRPPIVFYKIQFNIILQCRSYKLFKQFVPC